jgi:flavin-dependent dehydrogenase
VVKRGVEFCSTDERVRRVDFATHDPLRINYSFQFERAVFDEILLRHAAYAGATVLQSARVTDVLTSPDGRVCGVSYVQDKDGPKRNTAARWIVDASGRAGVLANRRRLRRPNPRLRMITVYRHFRGVEEDTNPGVEGDLQIGYHDQGWLWALPLTHDGLSVGILTAQTAIEGARSQAALTRLFDEHVQRIPRIAQRIAGETCAPRMRVRMETDFCYACARVWGPGFVLTGDAGCFADPVFSGGVFLAQITGERAAMALDDLLRSRASDAEALGEYERFYKTGYDTYFRLIYGYYEAEFNFPQYIKYRLGTVDDSNYWITRTLIGDFWSPENPITTSLRAVEGWDTFEPFEPLLGCPIYGDNREIAVEPPLTAMPAESRVSG